MQSLLHTLDGYGGIYVAMFLFAILSGVFPLANSEAAMVALGVASTYGTPKLVLLAVITALGQSVMHATLYQSARGIAKVSAKKRPRLEKKIAKARELGARWHKSELLLIALGATIGIPPQVLVALFAGAVGFRFPTFVAIDIVGRIARFTTIVLIAERLG